MKNGPIIHTHAKKYAARPLSKVIHGEINSCCEEVKCLWIELSPRAM